MCLHKFYPKADKQILDEHSYPNILKLGMRFNWLKLVTRLAAANQTTYFILEMRSCATLTFVYDISMLELSELFWY